MKYSAIKSLHRWAVLSQRLFFLLFTVQLLAIKRLLCCTKEDFNPLCSSVSIQSCDQPTKLFNQTTKSRISKRVFLSPFQFPCPSNTLTKQPMYQLGIKWIIQPKKSKRCFLSFRQFVCRPILLNNQPDQAIGKEKSFSHGTLTLDLVIICPC